MKQIYIYRKADEPDVVVLGGQTISRGVWTTVTEEQLQEIDQNALDSREVLVRDVEDMHL